MLRVMGGTLEEDVGAAKEPIFRALQLLVQYGVVGIGEWGLTHIPKIIRVSVDFLLFLFSLFQIQYKICMYVTLFNIHIYVYYLYYMYICTL